MSDNIPHEIVREILERLPVKTLGVCLCVCKSWHALITSASFITNHFSKTHKNDINKGRRFLFKHYDLNDKVRFSLHLDNDSFEKVRDLEFPLKRYYPGFRMVGYCNGVLCLSNIRVSSNFFLWNPSVQQKCVSLPPHPVSTSPGYHSHAVGFGFDSLSSNFKVVMLSFGGQSSAIQANVCSLSTNSWNDISARAIPYKVINCRNSVFVNGAIHWIASSGKIKRRNEIKWGRDADSILMFDVSHDSMRCSIKCVFQNFGSESTV
ncbi:F-box and associated interaction domains-containing protein putative isoform 1 [Tripterygium wilfordii]|uniref:F-box and associated interaction domains-containing protein putative isoform 1 n=1 Tax=Tripterygium wilfordii TaxID=458696 RepID=A0A7J7D107_TRIWF|nr:F-box/kelch-repeat protein At3g23880-like [Tripterygium wilfordii]KAF5740014.1 F-box and associated interaction domains-containing protein putative isoform 1 [Tripterygium wilfordii]